MESVYFIANQLNLELSKVEETLEPTKDNDTITGIEQIATGFTADRAIIQLQFIASIHQPNPEDSIDIQGEPNLHLRITPPVHGDGATASILINAIPAVLNAQPGLHNTASINTVTHWK